LEGVKLFRALSVNIDLETKMFSVQDKENTDDDKLIESLATIARDEYANIKELTDMEEGLRFALHRLLDLK